MGKFDNISEETIHENPWWKYKHDTYELPNGEEGDYFYLEAGKFVLAIPILNKEKLVLIEQYRYLAGEESIEFPAGHHHDEECKSIKESAKRELKEETGYTTKDIQKIGSFASSPGAIKNETHIFLAFVSEQKEQKLDDSEEISVLELPPNKFNDLIIQNKIIHGETIAAWSMVLPKIQKELKNFNI